MFRIILACTCLFALAGCAVIKTTDVTDASFKRHQSVSVLGWPMYTRVTDREGANSGHLATQSSDPDARSGIRHAELLDGAVEFDFSTSGKN